MTINLNQARKLAELGVIKQSEKIWAEIIALTGDESFILSTPNVLCSKIIHTTGVFYPAYNAEELLGMLKGCLEIYRHPSEKRTWQICGEYGEPIYGATLTEALCNKLIHDLENGIISVEEINK